MTPEQKLRLYKLAWRQAITEAIEAAQPGSDFDDVLSIAEKAVELADINGLLDPAKGLYAHVR